MNRSSKKKKVVIFCEALRLGKKVHAGKKKRKPAKTVYENNATGGNTLSSVFTTSHAICQGADTDVKMCDRLTGLLLYKRAANK